MTVNATGLIQIKLTGSSPVAGFIPKIGPENAIRAAVVTPRTIPTNTPAGRANGTNNAKKNRAAIGVVSKLVVLFVTAVMLPGISPIRELLTTTIVPIDNASPWAIRVYILSDLGRKPNRSKKSVVTTAVMELTPESILDIAAANIAAATRPEIPGGR